jgi:hypothetical protein
MRITGEVMVTEPVYRAAIKALLRRPVRMARVSGVGLAVCGLVLVAVDDVATGIAVIILAGAAGVLLPLRLVSTNVKRARPGLVSPWRYEITDDGLRIQTAVATSEFTWLNLIGHTDHRDFWLLWTPIKLHAVVVVKAAFSAEDQQAIADELRRRHIDPQRRAGMTDAPAS